MKIYLTQFRKAEDGAITAFSLYLFVIIFGILGIAVDYTNGVRNQAKLQAAADAAALAAMIDLPDIAAAEASGIQFARDNLTSADASAVSSENFVFGTWNKSTKTFFATNDQPNAVRVVLGRTAASGNPVRTFMLKIIGKDTLDVRVCAIAHGDSEGGCQTDGFFSGSDVISGSNNSYVEGFCLYGRKSVKVGSDNYFQDGVSLGMEDKRNLIQSQNNSGIEKALDEYPYDLILPDLASSLYTAFRNNTAARPAFLDGATVRKRNEISSSDKLIPNSIYIVKDVADLGDSKNINNIAVIAGKEIKVGSNTKTDGVVLVSRDKILIGSNNRIGAEDYCDEGAFSNYIFSQDNIEFGSNNYLRGVQMGSQNEVKLGSDVRGVEGVHAEATGNFDFGSSDTFGGCDTKLESVYANPDFESSETTKFAVVSIVR